MDQILMDSVKLLNGLNGKVKSGGMVRADKALQLANTYRTRSSMTIVAATGTETLFKATAQHGSDGSNTVYTMDSNGNITP